MGSVRESACRLNPASAATMQAITQDRLGGPEVLASVSLPKPTPVAREAAERGIRVAGLLVEADRRAMTALADVAAAGKLVPTIAATFPLDQAGAAQSAKAGRGKVVLTLS